MSQFTETSPGNDSASCCSRDLNKPRVVVGISELAVSDNPQELLITYSLGSCLGVSVYDPVNGIGGLIHCMLPLSSIDKEKAKTVPAMFVDTGIPHLFTKLFNLGSKKRDLVVKAAGCAQILDPQGHFKIGERNFTLLRKVLWKNEILLKAHDTGGGVSRTVSLDVASGKTVIRSGGQNREL